jgi:hypothetical protein
LNESAARIGELRAAPKLPKEPAYCREQEPHADVNPHDPWGTLDAEGLHLDNVNTRLRLCMGVGGFYDRVVSSQERATK